MILLETTLRVLSVLGAALAFGGTAALSFATAPAMFKGLKAVDAGRVFGRILRVFDAMAFWACAVAGIAAAGEAMAGEGPGASIRAVLAASATALLWLARRVISPGMAALKPPETEDEDRAWDPEKRRAFNRLHQQYVRIYTANLFLTAAALVVACLPT